MVGSRAWSKERLQKPIWPVKERAPRLEMSKTFGSSHVSHRNSLSGRDQSGALPFGPPSATGSKSLLQTSKICRGLSTLLLHWQMTSGLARLVLRLVRDSVGSALRRLHLDSLTAATVGVLLTSLVECQLVPCEPSLAHRLGVTLHTSRLLSPPHDKSKLPGRPNEMIALLWSLNPCFVASYTSRMSEDEPKRSLPAMDPRQAMLQST